MPQLSPGTARSRLHYAIPLAPAPPQFGALAVPRDPLQVALDQEVQPKKSAADHAALWTVYAFDHIVIPVGSEVTGHVTRIEGLTRGNAPGGARSDFTPSGRSKSPSTALPRTAAICRSKPP